MRWLFISMLLKRINAVEINEHTRAFRLQNKALRIYAIESKKESCCRPDLRNWNFWLYRAYIFETQTLYLCQHVTLPKTVTYTSGQYNDRAGQHRVVIYEHLPSLAGVHFTIGYRNHRCSPSTKTWLKSSFSNQEFRDVDEFLTFDWETARTDRTCRSRGNLNWRTNEKKNLFIVSSGLITTI